MARCRDACFFFALELNLTSSLYQSSLLCLGSNVMNSFKSVFLKEKKEKLLKPLTNNVSMFFFFLWTLISVMS